MELDTDVIGRAKKLRVGAVTSVLQGQVGGVYRLAYGLAGSWESGRSIARFVLNRSVKMMPSWDENDDPANWYHRFTILTIRRSRPTPTSPQKDTLVQQAVGANHAYIAFVSALRKLDYQQREAILLRYGEKLNARYSALAMDCSTTAVETHLVAAERALQLVAGPEYAPLLRMLVDAYEHLTPDPDQLKPTVDKVIFKRVVVRRWVKWVWFLVQLAIVALIGYGGWRVWLMIRT